MLCGSKTGRPRCSPDLQGVLRLQHQVCSPGGEKYLFKCTSIEQRLSTPTPWYCLVSDQNQDATEQAHFLGHLGGSILSPRHTTSSIDTDWTRPHSTTISEGQIYHKLDLASYHEEPVIMTTSSHGYMSQWYLLMWMSFSSWIGFPYVHGFTRLTTSKHWHCWNHCQDWRLSKGSSSYSCPQWVWYSGGNLQHWGTDSNQNGKEGQILVPYG